MSSGFWDLWFSSLVFTSAGLVAGLPASTVQLCSCVWLPSYMCPGGRSATIQVRIRESQLRLASCYKLVTKVQRRRVGHIAFGVAGPTFGVTCQKSVECGASAPWQFISGLKNLHVLFVAHSL